MYYYNVVLTCSFRVFIGLNAAIPHFMCVALIMAYLASNTHNALWEFPNDDPACKNSLSVAILDLHETKIRIKV